ncbi:alanine racemase [Mesorhizobium sp. L-8-10]|uniref:alanine racemase n=1 Tax=unclassified Mesorhizobium TaxID=325217 RepID=UPI0019283FA1|nr:MULTISPECIES: alanine racemase [unclassified Mesorhizobium]BCH20321.1 alanine racemase [Mesorhizobium sp. L-8-3]BCH28175.1 alanine racemase [Mesorhizobium sp. L-8-10]
MKSGVAALNAPLVGSAGSRSLLETPALLLDATAFEANIRILADLAAANGLGLRPHAKTHKCAGIAQRQMAAGALGIACAKPGELLALFDADVNKLMLTAPVASRLKIDRLAAAAARGADLTVVVDRVELVAAYGAAAREAGGRIAVLVDCDTGLGRTGVAEPEAAVALARAIRSEDCLVYAGIQAYAGHVQHVFGLEERRVANRAANERLKTIITALRAAGLAPAVVSGGGTGSHLLDFEDKLLTEVQAGSYVFMDEAYRPVDLHGTGADIFEFALLVAVTVIGHSASGEAITDGGTKSFAVDGPPPRAFLDGRELGLILWAGDEFGRLKTHPGIAPPPAGTRIECTVPHCDPTVNLHDAIHLVRGDALEAIWPIEGRGRSD